MCGHKQKQTFDAENYWFETFRQTKEQIIAQYNKSSSLTQMSILEKTYNAVVGRLENDNSEFRSLLTYYYTIQVFILGGFAYCYNMFYPTFVRGKSSYEAWILFSICLIGIVYCISLLFNYSSFSRAVCENYKHLIMLEPYVTGRVYLNRSHNTAKLFYKWETYSLCLILFIWIGLCLFITKAENPSDFFLLGTFSAITVIFIIFAAVIIPFFVVRVPEQRLQELRNISEEPVKQSKTV